MKVAVLGAGVVGVATAYYLARDGHEVVLIERRAKAAEEADAHGDVAVFEVQKQRNHGPRERSDRAADR